MQTNQSMQTALKRIVSNLLYLFGRWIAKKTHNAELLKNIIYNFIHGWIDGHTRTNLVTTTKLLHV